MKRTSTIIWRVLRAMKKESHSRVSLSGIFNACCCRMPFLKQRYVEDPRLQPSGMTALFNNGFTLVELLVVVLIIGVLTAVAVPMYQNAVDKSNFSTMIPTARALKEAEEAYWLANGYYTKEADNLDVSAAAGDVSVSFYTKED